jgi:adenylate cyclase
MPILLWHLPLVVLFGYRRATHEVWNRTSMPRQRLTPALKARDENWDNFLMAVEIERKFLVSHDGWKTSVVHCVYLRDGLIANYNGQKVRVRIAGEKATIALKGRRKGLRRSEFEYNIPVSDAEEILLTMCKGHILEKHRYFVQHFDAIWHVDVYEGIMKGIVIAEIELQNEGQLFELPNWIGNEVTMDSRYRKINMLAQRLQILPEQVAPE